jgi:signal transduction histidine kinase
VTAARVERRGMRARLASLPPGVADVAVALALAVTVTLAALESDEPGSHRSVAAAYALGGVLGALALVRRRWPVAVLLLSTVAVFAYHGANFPAIGSAWPLAVALYTCAAEGRLLPAVLVAAGTAAGTAVARLLLEPEPVLPVLSSGLRELAGIGLVLALGDAVRSRLGWAAEVQQRVSRLEHDREQEARRRVEAERLRIARELHDIMAHTLAVAGIQLNVAADTLDHTPGEAKDALRTAQQVAAEATAELKAAVRALRQERGGDLPRSPTPGLEDVGRMLEAAREAGLQVSHQQSGAARPLPAPVGLAVYRIVQEALTNVLRHAHATAVRVQVGYEPEAVSVRVADDGQGPPAAAGGPDGQVGHGLIGMRERALVLGGEFAAGPAPDGGFAVSARIPTEASS